LNQNNVSTESIFFGFTFRGKLFNNMHEPSTQQAANNVHPSQVLATAFQRKVQLVEAEQHDATERLQQLKLEMEQLTSPAVVTKHQQLLQSLATELQLCKEMYNKQLPQLANSEESLVSLNAQKAQIEADIVSWKAAILECKGTGTASNPAASETTMTSRFNLMLIAVRHEMCNRFPLSRSTICDVQCAEIYDKCMNDQIHPQQWHEWLTEEMTSRIQHQP